MSRTVHFRTENDSIYRLTQIGNEMRWERLRKTSHSGKVRNEGGRLLAWPILTIGQSAVLDDDAVRPGFDGHAVVTSHVEEVW